MKRHTYILLLILTACKTQVYEPTVYQIDTRLSPYLKTFVAESEKRGKTVVLENLILQFAKTSKEACGECEILSQSNGQRIIRIDTTTAFCWKSTEEQNREALVFHELGHCLLSRPHRTDKLPNDAAASIMYLTSTGLYEPCVYPISGGTDCDKRYRRAYYIDELFDEKTPVPTWGK